jgi:hypothetical protein
VVANKDYRLVHIVRASAGAPHFFKPLKIQGKFNAFARFQRDKRNGPKPRNGVPLQTLPGTIKQRVSFFRPPQ